jgi:hypothetical protein
LFDKYVANLRKDFKQSYRDILEQIKDGKGTVQEISEETGMRKQFISTACLEMRKRGLIFSIYGNTRNGFRYKMTEFGTMFLGGVPAIDRENFEKTVKLKSIEVITPSELLSMLKEWSKVKWEPKVTRTASYLPMGVSKLYQLAFDASLGSEITSQDLREIQYYLVEFRNNLEHTRLIMDRIINTPELWNPERFEAFLLSTGVQPAVANNLAQRMAEVNRQ